jgi:Flp pilus assembly pilin Flp
MTLIDKAIKFKEVRKMLLKVRKGQSVLEYTIILAAIIAAIIAGAGAFRSKVGSSLNTAGDIMEDATNALEGVLSVNTTANQ